MENQKEQRRRRLMEGKRLLSSLGGSSEADLICESSVASKRSQNVLQEQKTRSWTSLSPELEVSSDSLLVFDGMQKRL